ncbi:MAG: TIGR02597 family protein, partial [Limisphaerales bacterium]
AVGTVFKVTLGGALTTLYSFHGSDGSHPYGGLVQGGDGNFYGTTFDGGALQLGTIFQITASGTLTSLAEFGQINGANPTASLIRGSDGSFYGTTSSGGNFTTNGITYLYGTVFNFSGGTITTLNSFGPDNGALPYSAVALGSDNNFYGTTIGPGSGTAFKMQSDGTLASTTLNADGDQPFGALMQASDGNFYGTTRQTIFQLTPGGTATTIGNISGGSSAGLIQAADGNFYGTTTFGGNQSTGSVFRIVPRPQFALQPASQTVYSNASVVLSAAVTGIAPLNYQWRKNGVNIANATASSFAISSAQQSDSGTYTIAVTNGFGSSNSINAVVSVLPPTIVHFQNTTHNTDGSIGAAWSADIGTSYDLQFKSSLTNTQWSTVSSFTASSNSLVLNITPGANTQGFYRLSSYYNVSDPIGFVQLNLLGNSDSYVSVPFLRPAAATALVNSISSNVVTVTQQYPATWTANQFVYSAGTQSNTYYLRFTSGGSEGRTFSITANTPNSVTLNLNGSPLTGVAVGDSFVIEPYWTLNSIFPNGAGVNVSPTLGNRNTEILIPDFVTAGINLSAARIYFFHAGIWKQTGQSSTDHGDDILQLNAPLIVRHNVATNTTLVCVGSVPLHHWNIPLRTPDGSAGDKQDSYFGIARPIPVSLDDSGLISSGAFAASPLPGSRTDELFTFDNSTIAKNKSSSSIYFYWNNAWRRVGAGSAVFGATQVFMPGTGVIIRKGTNIVTPIWTNTPPY